MISLKNIFKELTMKDWLDSLSLKWVSQIKSDEGQHPGIRSLFIKTFVSMSQPHNLTLYLIHQVLLLNTEVDVLQWIDCENSVKALCWDAGTMQGG